MNNHFFSIDEEGDEGAAAAGAARPNGRSRTGSTGSDVHSLFPIYEAPQQVFALPPPDLDSTAGSEWESDFEGGGGRPGSSASTHLTSVSKEQLFQMLQKSRARYHKYKGRAADVVKAYQELEAENGKIKNVMQQTQVKNAFMF